VDLKDPTKWLGGDILDLVTQYVTIDGHSSNHAGKMVSFENTR